MILVIFLKQALRDRLVSGLHSKMARTQQNFLSKVDLTFNTAQTQCLADEMAFEANKSHMDENASKSVENHKIFVRKKTQYKASTSSSTGKKCYRCGDMEHDPGSCPFNDSLCHKC